jgi:hypothetical protein
MNTKTVHKRAYPPKPMTTRQAISIAVLALESEVLTADKNKHRLWLNECRQALPLIKNLKNDF